MKRKIKYTDEPMTFTEVEDFLPAPSELVLKEDTVKVTISLSRRSIDFFKSQAAKYDTAYQKMIRNLLDVYVIRNASLPAYA